MKKGMENISTLPPAYGKFIFGTPINRNVLFMGIGISVGILILFKILYPYSDFISDSYSYLFAAAAGLNISLWPIGYSKFLALFHHLTTSDTAVVCFQYLLLQLACFHLYFTLSYFYYLSKWSKRIIFFFIVVNPLSLYMCNTINSDALFAALSLFWFINLIWIINKPKAYHIVIQAVLLFLCFTIRNNAYYYPLITIIGYVLSPKVRSYKTVGMVAPWVLIVPFILFTQQEAKKITGTRQYSLFTGWQLANNALYIYDQVEVDSDWFSNQAAKDLNRQTIAYFKNVNFSVYRGLLDEYVGNFFIRQPEAPLKQYFAKHYAPKNDWELTRDWGKASADFDGFGKAIILRNPIAYLRFFVWPNLYHYIYPPLSHLEQYNYGQDKVDPIAVRWFHYRSNKVRCFSYDLQSWLLLYSFLFMLVNLYFLYSMGMIFINQYQYGGVMPIKSLLILGIVFYIANIAFSATTTQNILRYQVVPLVMMIGLSALMGDYLDVRKAAKSKNLRSVKPLYNPSKQVSHAKK